MAAFLVVTIVNVVLGVVGLVQLSNLNKQARQIYTAGAVPAEAVRSLEGTWFHYSVDLSDKVIDAFTPAQKAAYAADSEVQLAKLKTDIAAILKMPITPETATGVRQISGNIGTYVADAAAYPAAAAANNKAEIARIVEETGRIQAAIPGLLASAAKSQLAGAAAQAQQARSVYDNARMLIIILLVVGFGISITLALLTARSIIRPVRRTREVLDGLAAGDLSGRVEVRGSDELAAMATSLNTGLASMSSVVGLIRESAEGLTNASGELSQVAGAITDSANTTAVKAASVAQSAEEVSSNVSTVAAGAEEMSVSIREISVNATEAATVAADARTIAEQTTQTVTKLGDSSAEIGDVIKVITSIAQQTNLLALNATIEAARAGEAGKGFAVVASEVKELAQETARATEDIGHRVAAIQADTASAVEAISKISGVIDRVHGFQTTIASAVEEQNATTSEIGRNVGSAAMTSAEIAAGIASVAEAAEDANAGAQASRAAASTLAEMSGQLREAIGRFHG